MTKKQIVHCIAQRLGMRQIEAKLAVDMMLGNICDILCNDGRLELRNFGVFEVRERAARKARNPRTNQPIDVPPRRVVTFQPGKRMAAVVARNTPAAH